MMATYNVSILTAELITNLYLYGTPEKPSSSAMDDESLIRGPEMPSNQSGYTQVYSDAVAFMSTGAGRFANATQSPIVSEFMSGSNPPGYIPGQRAVFTLDQMNRYYSSEMKIVPGSFGIQQWEYMDGNDDVAERVYIHNSTPFRISKEALFITAVS